MATKSNFIEWLEQGSDHLHSVEKTVVNKSLTLRTVTFVDDRSFVVAENIMVSYDKGFYEILSEENRKRVKAILNKQYSL